MTVKILKYENFENKFLGVSYDTKYFNKIIKEDKLIEDVYIKQRGGRVKMGVDKWVPLKTASLSARLQKCGKVYFKRHR